MLMGRNGFLSGHWGVLGCIVRRQLRAYRGWGEGHICVGRTIVPGFVASSLWIPAWRIISGESKPQRGFSVYMQMGLLKSSACVVDSMLSHRCRPAIN